MNMHRQRTTIASRLTHPRWPTVSTIKQQSTNKVIYPKIKDRKTIAAIGMERVAMSSGRNSTISQPTIALSQCYSAVLTVWLYDPIRFYTTKIDRQLLLWSDVVFASPRWPNEKSPRSSAFYNFRTGEGGPGVIKFIPSAYVLGFL